MRSEQGKPGVSGYILAGGRSRRFGSDKARVVLGGLPLILHVAAALRPLTARLTVVAERADKYSDLGLRTIPDVVPSMGPVGGLLAALRDAARETQWLLLAPCDMAGIRRSWLAALLASRDSDAPAVAFRGSLWQPLPGLYNARLRPTVTAAVRDGEPRALWRVLGRCGALALPLPGDWGARLGVNSPSDLGT